MVFSEEEIEREQVYLCVWGGMRGEARKSGGWINHVGMCSMREESTLNNF